MAVTKKISFELNEAQATKLAQKMRSLPGYSPHQGSKRAVIEWLNSDDTSDTVGRLEEISQDLKEVITDLPSITKAQIKAGQESTGNQVSVILIEIQKLSEIVSSLSSRQDVLARGLASIKSSIGA